MGIRAFDSRDMLELGLWQRKPAQTGFLLREDWLETLNRPGDW